MRREAATIGTGRGRGGERGERSGVGGETRRRRERVCYATGRDRDATATRLELAEVRHRALAQVRGHRPGLVERVQDRLLRVVRHPEVETEGASPGMETEGTSICYE